MEGLWIIRQYIMFQPAVTHIFITAIMCKRRGFHDIDSGMYLMMPLLRKGNYMVWISLVLRDSVFSISVAGKITEWTSVTHCQRTIRLTQLLVLLLEEEENWAILAWVTWSQFFLIVLSRSILNSDSRLIHPRSIVNLISEGFIIKNFLTNM